jgi:hypothetical protein
VTSIHIIIISHLSQIFHLNKWHISYVLLKKLHIQSTPQLLQNQKLHFHVNKSPPLALILNKINAVHILSLHFSKIHFKIILSPLSNYLDLSTRIFWMSNMHTFHTLWQMGYLVLWFIALTALWSIYLISTVFYQPSYQHDILTSSLYACSHKIIIAAATGTILIVCASGYGGKLYLLHCLHWNTIHTIQVADFLNASVQL